MNPNYLLSPAMQDFVARSERFFPAEVIAQGIPAQRDAYTAQAAHFALPCPAGLRISDERLGGVPVRRYRPRETMSGPAILFAHGGGWYLGGLDSHDSLCAQLAHDCMQELIAVDYRLAPEAPFPAGLDDLTAVYRALLAGGAEPPLLLGDSAGGNLVAALTLRCRKQGLVAAAGQILIYPALAQPGSLPSHQAMADAPLLDRAGIVFCWQCYGGEHASKPAEELAPLLADSFEGLPAATVLAAQYDPLRDDAREYSRRLQAAGVAVSYCEVPGLVHGALRAVGRAEEADQLYRLICDAVTGFKHN